VYSLPNTVTAVRLKEEDMGGRNMKTRAEMYNTFWSPNLKGRSHLRDLTVDWKVISKWIQLAEVRIHWRAFVTTITIRQVP
jgi:hypothetical protein